MAAIRAFLILIVIVGFFLVGAPLQALIARRAPRRAEAIPRLFCRLLLWLANVRVTVRGTWEGGGPVLVVANHVSWIDILAFGASAPFCFLAKDDVARWPVISTFAKVQGTVFVDRRRRRSIIPANRGMAARMAEGRPVLLFPEGTTFAGPAPGPFRSSHFAAARELLVSSPATLSVAVLPVAIAYASPAAAWIGDDALLPHLWRTLRGPPIACTIAYGAPIAYTRGADRKDIARTARATIAGLIAARPAAAPASLAINDVMVADAIGDEPGGRTGISQPMAGRA